MISFTPVTRSVCAKFNNCDRQNRNTRQNIANNLSAVATNHKPDLDNIKVLCKEGKLIIPRRVRETIFIMKETSPTFNRDEEVNFHYMIHFQKDKVQLGSCQQQVSEVDKSVVQFSYHPLRTEKGFAEYSVQKQKCWTIISIIIKQIFWDTQMWH